jgi:hypothetical protein
VVVSLMKVSNTLLGAAVTQKQARFVADVGAYMQTSARPARDIFTRASRLVSSVVVVPLVVGDEAPLGGLYFALDTPCEFVNISDTLLVRPCVLRLLTPDTTSTTAIHMRTCAHTLTHTYSCSSAQCSPLHVFTLSACPS